MMFEKPVPTGLHAAAIGNLDEARRMMDQIQISDGAGNHLTLAGIYDLQISAMIGSIDSEYKRVWMRRAAGPLEMPVNADGKITFDTNADD